MLDKAARRLIDPPLARLAGRLAPYLTPNQVTLIGFGLGLTSAALIAANLPLLALLPLLLSRLADGLDGAVARIRGGSDFGGYLDILCDFAFYGAVPAAFVFADPTTNGTAGAFLLASFYTNGASFLGFALLADRHGMETKARGTKALYFSGGLLEGTETIAFFVTLCLLPGAFPLLAWVFGALCFWTALARALLARQLFKESP